MPRVPYITAEAVQAMIDDAAQQNPAVRDVDPSSLYDNSYVQELIKDGFVKSVMPNYKGA